MRASSADNCPSSILGYATMGGLALWTVLYRRHCTRYGKALRAKAAAERQAR